jgi:hypothetical protein
MNNCKSCGIEWTEHLGMIGTCKRVQDQAAEIERLKTEVERLNNIGRNLWAGWPEALYPGMTESLHGHKCHHPKMILCKTCGTGRCPAAGDERMKCTGRNEPG